MKNPIFQIMAFQSILQHAMFDLPEDKRKELVHSLNEVQAEIVPGVGDKLEAYEKKYSEDEFAREYMKGVVDFYKNMVQEMNQLT